MSINNLIKSLRESFEYSYNGKCILQTGVEGAIDHFIIIEDNSIIYHRKGTFDYPSDYEPEKRIRSKKFDTIELCIEFLISNDQLDRRILHIEKEFAKKIIETYSSKNISPPNRFILEIK